MPSKGWCHPVSLEVRRYWCVQASCLIHPNKEFIRIKLMNTACVFLLLYTLHVVIMRLHGRDVNRTVIRVQETADFVGLREVAGLANRICRSFPWWDIEKM